MASLISLAWILVTLCCIVALVARIFATSRSTGTKVALSAGLVGGWIALQGAALILGLTYGYCENCADRPVDLRYILVTLILLSPTLALVALVVATRAWRRRTAPS